MKLSGLFIFVLVALYNSQIIGIGVNSQNPATNDSLINVEKVYLHVDRDYYVPGEDIWFKAYLIDASDRLLSDHSNNLHVELISPASEIIYSRIVSLNGGLGNGDFRLNENLQSGQYLLRAYTNYMRNFSDQLFFNKAITIISSSDTIEEFSDSIKYINNKLEITFFPEGGSLVDNVNSIVAFKAVNALGVGCDVSGEIYSSTGKIVTEFRSTNRGMGAFSFRPVPELDYYAIVKNQYGYEVETEIPESFSTGLTLNISKNESDELLVTVRTNLETLPLALDNDLILTVSARNIILKEIIFRLKSLNNQFILPVDDLPVGIVMLTLSGLNNLPLCERLFYFQNNEDIKVNLETNKTVYQQRDSVSVKISLTENSGTEQEAFLSLSAAQNNSTKSSSQFPTTISSWFLLESDIRGPVEEPSYYFDPSNPNRLKDLDLLLLTQGWRDFEWKYEDMLYPPENGFTVSGRLRRLIANLPIDNSKINIVIINNGNSLISTVSTDASGRFSLEGIDLTGDARLIASAIGRREKFQGRLLLDSLHYSPAEVQDNMTQMKLLLNNDNQLSAGNLNALIQDLEIKETIRKKYKLGDTISLGEVKIIAKRYEDSQSSQVKSSRILYGMPDKELIITPELESYSTIMEVIAGRVSGVSVGMPSGDDSGIRIRGSLQQPLFILDGTEAPYYIIASLSVSWIDRIDVLKSFSASTFGVRGANGVISIITRSGVSLSTDNPVSHSVNLRLSGYNEPRIFYSPQHSPFLESDYKPDMRTTLYWKPDIKVVNNKDLYINYFNADNSSIVKVIVEGITTTGIPVTGMTEYEVR